MALREKSANGFILADALAALIVGAGVLAAVYSLISSASRGSASARDAIYASTAAHSLCQQLGAAGDLAPGRIAGETGGLQTIADVTLEPRPNLPEQAVLWRIDCAAARGGLVLASERTYALKARRP